MTKKTKKKTPKKESKKKPNIYDGCEIEDFIQKLVDSKPENPSKNKDLTPSGDDKEDYCESESCNTPNLPIFKCPQFEKIACTLVAAHWEIDARAIERNILLISRESQKCILHLFYGDKKANAWLTDEEEFNGESPLWFSESSHVISPIYTVTKYHKELDATEFEFSQSIVILMHPHYTLNADEKIDEWGDTLVVSLERFCALIEQEEQLDFVTTKIDDVGKEPHRDKKYQNNKEINIIGYLKFDDNLQSWQKTDKNKTKGEGRHTEELTCNNNIDTVMDDFNEIEIKRIRFGMECPDNDYCEHNSSLLTHFISGKKGILTLDIEISGIPDTSRLYLLELLDERGKRVANDYSYFHPSVRRTIDITLPPLEAGYYTFSLKSASKELYNQRLKFVDLEYGYKKYINLEGFALYRIEDEDNEIDHMHIMERGAMSCYNHDGLAGLLSVVIIKNISTREIPYQAILIIKNEVGEVIYEDQNHGELDIDEIYVFTSEVMDVVCKRGNYTVILKFMGEVILVGDFVVGKRDIKGAFKLDQLFSRSGRNSVIVNSPSDSMKEIDQMIGLKSLKKQLHKSIAKIKLDRLREKEGLPIKPQQLHMAFLGNPGTGKTTVAKLLGQVYKSIGLLSKGHVVLEDRTTLMTQNWGGEGEMVNKALDKAQGGILFIDEAYDLVTEHKTDPGKLIISALLQAMSDESSRNIMIIFAGYTLPMERLLSKNPGLRSRLTSMYFDDYNVEELMQIADLWLERNCYSLTTDARSYLESTVATAYASRGDNFGNARYVVNLLENEIQPAMAERVMTIDNQASSFDLLTTIEASDIPNNNAEKDGAEDAIEKLDKMVGLRSLKGQIRSHLSYIRFVQARRNNKIDTPIPPLHMIFTGNPGTGKTSVAEYLGDIYRSMGVLSTGNVIKVTRADMIDQYIGGTEEKMKELLNAAHGNILFIDEAYTLFSKNDKDVGKNAINALLDTLGKENPDMIVIMAGYSKEMEELLSINPGLKGRFPYTFNFEDYDEDELYEIALSVIERNSLNLTNGAEEALKAIIRKECKTKDSNFSNARFVVRLITTQVLPNMAMRLEGETDSKRLKRIYQKDIPIEHKEIEMINNNLFDEDAIESALSRLDAMIGLTKVKVAIHQFVDFARVLNRKDPTQIERYPLKWSFVGNTGTGKSSVAEILSEILKAMHLLGKGHTVEVNAEELYGVATYKADELLQQRMRESLQGLLFVDGDAPQFRVSNSSYNPDYLRMCLAVNTAEIHGRFAVVIAEQDSPRIGLAKSLNKIGINNFNHTLIFDDYSAEELMAILSLKLKERNLQLSTEAATIMYSYIKRLVAESGQCEANARSIKELSNAIHSLITLGKNQNKIIDAEIVAPFAQPQSTRKSIGY